MKLFAFVFLFSAKLGFAAVESPKPYFAPITSWANQGHDTEEVNLWLSREGISVHAHVLNPAMSCSSVLQTKNVLQAIENLPIVFAQDDWFLEMGCGCALTSMAVASQHSVHVDAVDINKIAVITAYENVREQGFDSLVKVRYSDLFSHLPPQKKYRVIYWEIPYYRTLSPKLQRGINRMLGEMTDGIRQAVYDENWDTFGRFLAQVKDHLAEDGVILIGWGDERKGATDSFREFCRSKGFEAVQVAPEGDVYKYKVFQLTF